MAVAVAVQYQNVPKIAELNDKTKQIKKDLHSQIFKDFARCAPPTTCPAGPTSVFILIYQPTHFWHIRLHFLACSLSRQGAGNPQTLADACFVIDALGADVQYPPPHLHHALTEC